MNILTQDKTTIVNYNHISEVVAIKSKEGYSVVACFKDEDEYRTLGDFKTEEDAKAVVDDIFECIALGLNTFVVE